MEDLVMKSTGIAETDATLDGLEGNAMINAARIVKGHFVIETAGFALVAVLMAIQDHCVCKVGQ